MTRLNREKIYNMLSPRILEKKARRDAVLRAEAGLDLLPPEVDNAEINEPEVAHSLNVQPVIPEPVFISPNEGLPAVNGQAEKLDIRPITGPPAIDPGVGAIPLIEKKKPGRPKKDSSTKK